MYVFDRAFPTFPATFEAGRSAQARAGEALSPRGSAQQRLVGSVGAPGWAGAVGGTVAWGKLWEWSTKTEIERTDIDCDCGCSSVLANIGISCFDDVCAMCLVMSKPVKKTLLKF